MVAVANDANAKRSSACIDPPPPRPIEAVPGNTGPLAFAVGYMAFDDIKVDDAHKTRLCSPIGADLDELDSRGPNPASRCASRSGQVAIDKDGGIDNQVAGLTSFADGVANLRAATDPNLLSHGGLANLLIRITGYSGEPNDDEVFVGMMVSAGLTSQLLDGGPDARPPPRPDLTSVPVVWNGETLETWAPEASHSSQDGTPLHLDLGYVSEGVLVVPIDKGTLPFGSEALPFRRGRLTAEIVDTHAPGLNRFALVRGRLVGAIEARAFIDAVAASKAGPLQFCDPSLEATFGGIKAGICGLADLSPVDGGPCDELSIGYSFVAVPAIFGTPALGRFLLTPACDGGYVSQGCD